MPCFDALISQSAPALLVLKVLTARPCAARQGYAEITRVHVEHLDAWANLV